MTGTIPASRPPLPDAHVLGYQVQARGTHARGRHAARSLAFEEAAQWLSGRPPCPSPARRTSPSPCSAPRQPRPGCGLHARPGDLRAARPMPDPLVRLRAAMGFEEATWRRGGPTPGPPIYSPRRSRTAGSARTTPLRVRRRQPWAGRSRSPAQPARARAVGDRAIDLARAQRRRADDRPRPADQPLARADTRCRPTATRPGRRAGALAWNGPTTSHWAWQATSARSPATCSAARRPGDPRPAPPNRRPRRQPAVHELRRHLRDQGQAYLRGDFARGRTSWRRPRSRSARFGSGVAPRGRTAYRCS